MTTTEKNNLILFARQAVADLALEALELNYNGKDDDALQERISKLLSNLRVVRDPNRDDILTEEQQDSIFDRIICLGDLNLSGTTPSSQSIVSVPAFPSIPQAAFSGLTSDTTTYDGAVLTTINFTAGTLNQLITAIDNEFTTITTNITTLQNGKVDKSLFDANTILKADSDDTPVAETISEGELVGRATAGVITGLTQAQIFTEWGITASIAELNILNGVTASAGEINHLVGVSSNIQVQITGNDVDISNLDTRVIALEGKFPVDTADIADGAIETAKIDSNAVTINELDTTGVTPGSYTLTNLTVTADGRITAASNGTPSAVPDASNTTKGVTKLSVAAASPTNPIAVGDNDTRVLTQVQKDDLTDAGQSALHYHDTDRARANHTGTQTASTISDFQASVEAIAVKLTDVGVASGVCDLDGSGLVPVSRLPALTKSETDVVSSQAAQLALSNQEGDIVVRTDQSTTYIRLNTFLGTMADYQEIVSQVQVVTNTSAIVDVTESPAGTFDFDIADLGITGAKIANLAIDFTKLTDFNISSPTNGQLMQYNSGTSKWENATIAGLVNDWEVVGGNLVTHNLLTNPNVLPETNNAQDLGEGTTPLRWKDLYLSNGIDYATTLIFEEAGSETFRLHTGGDVGIGIGGAPGAKLDIASNGTSTTALRVKNTSYTADIFAIKQDASDGGQLELRDSANGLVCRLATDGTTVSYYNNGKFVFNGTSLAFADVLGMVSSGTSTAPFGIKSSAAASALLVVLEDGSGNGYWRIQDISPATKVQVHSAGDTYFNGGDVGISSTSFNSASDASLVVGEGTPPDGNVTGAFQMYGADSGGAGTVSPFFRTEDGDIIKLYKEAALTATLTTITHTAPGTPDYLIQDLIQPAGFGFATKDEGNTVLSVIANLQARVNELETRLQAHGLIT